MGEGVGWSFLDGVGDDFEDFSWRVCAGTREFSQRDVSHSASLMSVSSKQQLEKLTARRKFKYNESDLSKLTEIKMRSDYC